MSIKKIKKLANGNFLDENYTRSLPLYQKLDSIYPDQMDYKYRLGICYLYSSGNKEKATNYLETVMKYYYKEDKKAINSEMYYQLAKSYHINHRFDKAISTYKKVLFDEKIKEDFQDHINRQIKMCNNGKELIKDPIDVRIENVGAPVNTKYKEHSPVISTDESILIFTSRRPGNVGGRQNVSGKLDPTGEYFEDVFLAYRRGDFWTKPYSMKGDVNTKSHEATIGLSPDGQTIFLYLSDEVEYGDVYTSAIEGNVWTKPVKLNANINSDFLESSASLSGDQNELYFSSNREGGYGGKDIYRSKKLPSGEWGQAENLGRTVNTMYDEDAPFIHPDGKTLYYSSKGHNSMGGYDIFRTIYGEDQWSNPHNIGYPINTADDDIFFVLTASSNRAYFSSGRGGGFGDLDIYVVHTTEDFGKAPVLTLVKGVVKSEGEPVKAHITVVDNETNLIRGVYESNAATGKYIIVINPERNYNIKFEAGGSLLHSENIYFNPQDSFIQVIKNVDLAKGKPGDQLGLPNLFFDKGKSELKPESMTELKNLRMLLSQNPSLVVEIACYVDTTKEGQGIALAVKRAKAVAKDLIENGIDPNRFVTRGYAIGSEDENQKERISLQIIDGAIEKVLMVQREFSKGDVPPDEEITLKDNFFAEGESEINQKSTKKLDEVKALLNEGSDKIIEIAYYIDPTKENQDIALAEQRAEAVADFLIEKGIDSERIVTKGYLIEPDAKGAEAKQRVIIQMYERTIPVELIAQAKSDEGEQGTVDFPVTLKDEFFDEGEADFKPKQNTQLEEVQNLLTNNGSKTVEIAYYIDTTKKDQNIALAKQRAESVADYLVGKGVDPNKIVTKAYAISVGTTGEQAQQRIVINLIVVEESVQQKFLFEKVREKDDFMLTDMFFEEGSSELKTIPSQLEQMLEFLTQNEEVVIELDYYIDLGKENQNLLLAEERASALASYLIENGIDPNRIITKGFGMKQNETEKADVRFIEKSAREKIVSKTIYFDFNKSMLRSQSQKILQETSNFLKNNPEFKFIVVGHTDFKGPYLYNQSLSEKRAHSVTRFAESKGVVAGRMSSKGYGETRPAASNATTDGRQLNRRADLFMINVDELKSQLNISSTDKLEANLIDKILQMYGQYANKNLIYKVQVGAYKSSLAVEVFSKIYDIKSDKFADGITRYTTGQFGTFNDAAAYKQELRKQGYHDAFVIAYLEGDKVDLNQYLAYKVQVAASRKPLAANSRVFNKIKDIQAETFNDGWIRYMSGAFRSLNDVEAYKKELKRQGFYDAFVVTYVQDEKIDPPQYANAIIRQNDKLAVMEQPQPRKQLLETLNNITFGVQVAAYSYQLPKSSRTYSKFKDVKEEITDDGIYRYTAGNFHSLAEVISYKKTLLSKGHKDVFVVAYSMGQRITLDEAESMM